MRSQPKARIAVLFTLSLVLFCGVVLRVHAQGAIGSILGTVTDTSGAVVAGAKIQATNTGTNAVQTTTSDAEGRYHIPALPVGTYDVQSESMGFQTSLRRGITLNPGADVIIDFPLTVGQISQTVIVESSVPQVEMTSAALGTVVEPTQMRELPLNGRNFEELVQLSPGVNVSRGSGTTQAAFTGKEDYWTVSGSRPNGQAILMDGTSINTYQDRGTGSGILGSSLGVDAIAEFQMLTNTYGAQYGGNGAVVNSVTRSGTNVLHGSAYDFTRNSIFDAIAWPSTEKNNFWKYQYGGTLGGPIKKDKMFFFGNYEGINQSELQNQLKTVPDVLTQAGVIPIPSTGVSGKCTTAVAPPGLTMPAGYQNCGVGSANAATFSIVQPYMALFPLGPGQGGAVPNSSAISGLSSAKYGAPTEVLTAAGAPTGTAQMVVSGLAPGREQYALGRYDWVISEKDNLFARYLFDNAYEADPFRGSFPAWPEFGKSRNQFVAVGEKHIFSGSLVNSFTAGYTRTYFDIYDQSINPETTQGVLPTGSLNWSGNLWTLQGEPYATDGSLALGSGISTLGGQQIGPIRKLQVKKSGSEDLFWVKGAHSFRFGGSALSSGTEGIHPFPAAGTWTFANLTNFILDSPTSFNGPCNFSANEPGCTQTGVVGAAPLPTPTSFRADRHWEFAMYVQDDWKLRSNVTLNLGLRYDPETTAYDATKQTYILLPVPYGTQPTNQPPSLTTTPPATLTPTSNFFLHNPSLHNFDPRIGLAWSPMAKTSIRAGYGIFHAILQCRDYCYGSWFNYPWVVRTSSGANANTFPLPNQNSTAGLTSTTWGTNPYITTPYMQQWNLSIQREVAKNTILTVAYVGSHGVHMLGQTDSNPPLASGVTSNAYGSNLGVIELSKGQTLWPNFPGYLNNLQCDSSSVCSPAPNANAALGPVGTPTITCTTPNPVNGFCNLATSNGQPIIDPSNGLPSYAHVASTGSTFSVAANQRWNPNFSYLIAGQSNINSNYQALQTGLARRLSNGLSAQFSYTYSSCLDISSGNWSQEGGTRITDAYNLNGDRGPCTFSLRHSISANSVYLLPFHGNRLKEGWQTTGIFYWNTGGPFSVSGISNLSNDPIAGAQQSNYQPNAPGCNGNPYDKPYQITSSGAVQYLNPACFAVPAIGEVGASGRNQFFGPHQYSVNMSLQKTTKISERYSLQIRVEGFNIFNRRNFQNPVAGFTQGSTSNYGTAITGAPNATFGQIQGINGTARQIQLGAKFTF